MEQFPIAFCTDLVLEKEEDVKVEDSKSKKHSEKNKHMFNYSKELIMLKFIYEKKLITEDEMKSIRSNIMKSYGIDEAVIPK